MSGGLKRAQHALERPLDRRVGPRPGGRDYCAHLPMVARQAHTARSTGRTRATDAGRPSRALPYRARGSSADRACTVPSLAGYPLAAEGRTARRALNGRWTAQLLRWTFCLATSMQRETGAFELLGDKLTVSGPPTDGQPGCERLEMRPPTTRVGCPTLRAQEERTVARLDHSAARTTCLANWGPTFDMSGSRKCAKRACGCPLDGGVRRRHRCSARWLVVRQHHGLRSSCA